MTLTCARELCKPERYSEDVFACSVLQIASGLDSDGNFAVCMLRAITILAQRLKVGPSACLEPLAQEDNSFLGNSNGAGRATMDSASVQAPVTGFSLTDKRQRGAALAGPYVHGAMCVLACACTVFPACSRVCSET